MYRSKNSYKMLIRWLATICVVIATGCSSGPSRVDAPEVVPDEVAQNLMDQYDENSDGSLSDDEVSNCPAIASSKRKYDQDGNGSIDKQEISRRLTNIYSDRIGIFQLHANVMLDGRPLRNALITLVPEQSMEASLAPATGTTDHNGRAVLGLSESDTPSELRGIVRGVQTGLYRIRVTSDKESLGDDIENGTVLGEEITPVDGDRGIQLRISRRRANRTGRNAARPAKGMYLSQ
ncbi:EF-hand domain-containing protein [Adhaeretor mobilis]|nr:hypothetical protein [Adhaeretor mobilis]